MKFLITGGAGFVGSNMAQRLSEIAGNEVVVVDNLATGSTRNVPDKENVVFIKGDVNDYNFLNDLFSRNSFDYVFHYAAVVGVKRTLDNPILVLQDIEGFKNVFGLSASSGVKRVLFSSSSEVYGVSKEFPQHETETPLNARLPYAIVKSVGEAYLESFQKTQGLEYTAFRFFNTYGPKQSSDYVMSKFIRAALKNEDITIYGDGTQTRTFCFINDNIEACINALTKNKIINGVVNIGSDIEVTIGELAQKIIDISGSKSKIVYLAALEEGDMPRRKPDITLMRQELLDREFTSIELGIKETIDFIKSTDNYLS